MHAKHDIWPPRDTWVGIWLLAVCALVVAMILVGGGMTGAAMNPARALGPALVSQTLIGHAVYWIGPVIGAAAAAGLWGWLLKGE